MKHFLSIIILALCATLCYAQEDVMQKAMEGYKNMTSLQANVKKTVHNTMVTKDQVSTGMFYFKKPALMCITTNEGKDKLLTDGESFTIVQNGKASTAKGSGNSSLTPLVNAIKGMTNGDSDTDLSDVADVDVENDGNKMVMTIVPITKTASEKRKLIYQSFVITIDTKVGELRSIRLCGKGDNWEQYDFSAFKKDVVIKDEVFK